MTKELFTTLLAHAEDEKLDFKRDPYRLDNEVLKSRLIKDIISIANTNPPDKPGYILIGVKAWNDRGTPKRELKGVSEHPDDADLHTLIRDKIVPPPSFLYYPFEFETKSFGVLEIRPMAELHQCRRKYGELEEGQFYTRKGSQNAVATSADLDELRRQRNLFFKTGEQQRAKLVLAHHYPMPHNWVGREDELNELRDLIIHGQFSILVIKGIGGVGKSSLAWRLIDTLPDTLEGIMWWSFYHDPSFDNFVERALRFVSAGTYDQQQYPTTRSKVLGLCEALSTDKFVLILDGFERLTRAYAVGSQLQNLERATSLHDGRACISPEIRRFLLGCCGGHFETTLIITTRYVPSDLELQDGALPIGVFLRQLDGLAEDAAIRFLTVQGVKGYRSDLLALGRHFDFHRCR